MFRRAVSTIVSFHECAGCFWMRRRENISLSGSRAIWGFDRNLDVRPAVLRSDAAQLVAPLTEALALAAVQLASGQPR